MLSENSDLTGASYVDITARPTQTTTFTLTETDGLKTVYGRLLKSDTTTVDLSATITLDTTAPSAASTFTLEQLTGSLANRIKLTWLNPSNSDLDTAVIVFKTTGAPTSVTDGTEIYNASAAPGASGTYTHLGLTYYTTYYYAVFMKDLAGNYSAAKTGYLKLMPPGPYFAIAVDSTNKVAGAAFNITITAKDGTGATLTTYSDSVELSAVYISPSSGVTALTTVTTGVFTAGIAACSARYDDAGTIQVKAVSDSASTMTGTSAEIRFRPASFSVTVPSAVQSAGDAFTATVTAKNYLGTVTPNYRGAVNITMAYVEPATGTKSLTGTLTLAAANFTSGVASISDLKYLDAGSIKLTAKDITYVTGVTIQGTSSDIVFRPSKFSLVVSSPPSSRTKFYTGEKFTFTLTAQTSAGLTTPNYRGTVNVSGSSSSIFGLASHTFTATDAGAHTFFDIYIMVEGSAYTITAADSAYSALTATSSAIGAISATVEVQSTSVPVGPTEITVVIKDSTGQVVTTDNSTSIMITVVESTPNNTIISTARTTAVRVTAGVAIIPITNSEAESVTITPVSIPNVLRPASGTVSFGVIGSNGLIISYWWEVTTPITQTITSTQYTQPALTSIYGSYSSYNPSSASTYDTSVSMSYTAGQQMYAPGGYTTATGYNVPTGYVVPTGYTAPTTAYTASTTGYTAPRINYTMPATTMQAPSTSFSSLGMPSNYAASKANYNMPTAYNMPATATGYPLTAAGRAGAFRPPEAGKEGQQQMPQTQQQQGLEQLQADIRDYGFASGYRFEQGQKPPQGFSPFGPPPPGEGQDVGYGVRDMGKPMLWVMGMAVIMKALACLMKIKRHRKKRRRKKRRKGERQSKDG